MRWPYLNPIVLIRLIQANRDALARFCGHWVSLQLRHPRKTKIKKSEARL